MKGPTVFRAQKLLIVVFNFVFRFSMLKNNFKNENGITLYLFLANFVRYFGHGIYKAVLVLVNISRGTWKRARHLNKLLSISLIKRKIEFEIHFLYSR